MNTILDYLWEQLRHLDSLIFFLIFFLFQWNRRHGGKNVPLAACYILYPYQSLLSLGTLASTGNLLSKVDKEKCNSGLIHAFIKTILTS